MSIDLPPGIRSINNVSIWQNFNWCSIILHEGGFCHEEEPVHRGTDSVCAPPGRAGDDGGGSDPEDGDQRTDVLSLEEESYKKR